MEIVLHPRSPTLDWIRSLGKPNLCLLGFMALPLQPCGDKTSTVGLSTDNTGVSLSSDHQQQGMQRSEPCQK